jgi:hypothetical protein
MRLIIDAFWMANCWTARVLTAPLEFFVYPLSLLLTRRSKGKRRIDCRQHRDPVGLGHREHEGTERGRKRDAGDLALHAGGRVTGIRSG